MISGGYVTPNSGLRNGRVLAFNLAALRGGSPSVETFNARKHRGKYETLTIVEDGSERNKVTLGASFMP